MTTAQADERLFPAKLLGVRPAAARRLPLRENGVEERAAHALLLVGEV